jgi:glutathione S-transferase
VIERRHGDLCWRLRESQRPWQTVSAARNQHGHTKRPRSHQPFGQVPWLTDGDISIFESGAILLHLGERSDALMPADPHGRSEVIEWLFAALPRRSLPASAG